MNIEELYGFLSESKTSMNAEDISKIIESRKAISQELWNKRFHKIEYNNRNIYMVDVRKKYFEILNKYLESALLYKNKQDLIALFDQLPQQDIEKEMGVKKVGEFIDKRLESTNLDLESAEILLSPELKYTRVFEKHYDVVPILQNLIFSNAFELVPHLLEKYPILKNKEAWEAIYSSVENKSIPDFKGMFQILSADTQNKLKNVCNRTLSTLLYRGVDEVSKSHLKNGAISAKDSETTRDCIALLRMVLNKGAQFDKFVHNWIRENAKWGPFCEELPKPTATDSGYRDFYNLIMSLHNNHLLAHRMDILGETTVEGIKMQLHGGAQATMVPEARKSFDTFLDSNLDDLAQDIGTVSGKVDARDFKKTILEVKQDLSEILMTGKDDEIKSRLTNHLPIHIPIVVKTKKHYPYIHATAVSIADDLFLISDRGRDEKNGIEIYKIEASENDKIQTLKMLGDSGHIPQNRIDSKHISQDLATRLNLTQLDLFARSEQYGENCSWNSSAKMIILSALYLRFYQLAKNNNMSQENAMSFAKNNSNIIYKKWSKFDKMHFLKNYLNSYLVEENKKYSPDPILLSMIYLRNEHKPKYKEITEILRNSGYINEETLAKAQDQIYQMAEFLLNDDLPPNFAHDNPELMDKIIKSLTEFFIRTDKSAVNQVFSAVEEKIKSDQLDEIPALLDDALAKLQSNKIEYNASPVFHQYREQSKTNSPGTLKKQEPEETSRKSLGPK